MEQDAETVEQLRARVGRLERELEALRQAEPERAQIETALRQSEERYRAFVRNSSEGIWRFELEQPVSVDMAPEAQVEHFYAHAYLAECNQAMAEMYGLSRPEELVGARLGELLVREDPHNVEYLCAFIASGYQLLDAESHEVDGAGQPRYFLNNLVGVVEGGQLLRAWGTQRDITRHKQEDGRRRFLVEASRLLGASLEISTTLASLAALAVPTLADWCSVHLLEPGPVVRLVAQLHRDPGQQELLRQVSERYPIDLSAPFGMGQVLRTGEPFFVPAFPAAPQQLTDSRARDLAEVLALSAVMIVPLLVRGETRGGITLARSSGSYAEQDLALAQELAARAATAIDNASLYQAAEQARHAAERAMERTARLQSLVGAFSEALLPAQVADVVLTQGLAVFGAGAGSIVLLDVPHHELELIGAVGYPPDVLSRWRRFPADSPVPLADAIRAAAPIWIETAEDFTARYPLLAAASPRHEGAWAAIPLMVDGHTIGGMGLSFSETRDFTPEDRAFILALAHYCAQALERARLYEEIQQALQTRDQFISLAAHELKTPLTAILGGAQLLQRRVERGELGGDRDRRAAQTLVDQVRRLHRLSNSLLDVSRMQDGRFTIAREPLDLCALISQIAAEIEPTLTQHTLQLAGLDTSCRMLGDQLRLEQVFQNLLHNAVKYSPHGGVICISCTFGEHEARVTIADEGLGIPAAALPRIFERFYRASNVNTRQISGMGVGLYVVREIVALHGGSIEVQSAEGAGSTFIVHLPLDDL